MDTATLRALKLSVKEWKERTKHICKPCWELKYCPYGPLVEDFPLKERRDDRSCRNFGHDCPVFTCNEPITEGEELRNISRNIPFKTKLRVALRDNFQCQKCGKSLLIKEIRFHHKIPYVKGGPSEEHNLQVLCEDCNFKKGSKYKHK
jgi:hypothetical protein